MDHMSRNALQNRSSNAGVLESKFLLLPLELRERIYSFAGLVRKCPINIEMEHCRWSKMQSLVGYTRGIRLPGKAGVISWQSTEDEGPFCTYDMKWKPRVWEVPGMGCVHASIPVGLLRASKQIHAEATQILWSKNTIIIGSTLVLLPWLKLELLTSLEIQLTTCSCVPDHECWGKDPDHEFNSCDICHFGCKRGTGNPLSLADDKGETILRRWENFCTALRERCSSDLELTLICDCMDNATALEVVRPLQNFPILKHANVRLGQAPGDFLGSLSRQTVQALVGRYESSPFPFMRLPGEIQSLVLSHTDLVAPCYLSWYEPVVYQSQFRGDGTEHNFTYSGFSLYGRKQTMCCVQCTRSREVCVCVLRHAAYSSRPCRCWKFPGALFLVNRLFNQQSAKIFFSGNRFVLWEAEKCDQSHPIIEDNRNEPDSDRLEWPLEFLKNMPSKYSMHLRWITFNGPGFQWSECLNQFGFFDSRVDQWTAITRMIRQLPSLPQLTLELGLAPYHGPDCSCDDNCGWWVHQSRVQEAHRGLWHLVKLFKPTSTLGYKNFYVRAAHTVDSEEEDWTRWHLEQELERYIMGETYDAAANGKYHEEEIAHAESKTCFRGCFDESSQPMWYIALQNHRHKKPCRMQQLS